MAFINWNDKLSVQVAAMDLQHQQLINLINKLHDAMMAGQAKEQIGTILKDLVGYTKKHFAAEEAFMLSIRYPQFAAHKGLHDQLTRKVIDLQQRIQQGELVTPNTVLTFLNSWLINHIEQEDKRYGQHSVQVKVAANQ